ncbi:hypothetical protein N656DRAFT_334216 [Canariomyces notabilis]|uniref:Uncharacterized protein n=1 Tax=Canariomyces notabilis TaxID=2074819 RepID=A0AAN6TA17_9PEZI|nr:hypothetical protein N656DRAFT_334216 [Canariomyces arenarius]
MACLVQLGHSVTRRRFNQPLYTVYGRYTYLVASEAFEVALHHVSSGPCLPYIPGRREVHMHLFCLCKGPRSVRLIADGSSSKSGANSMINHGTQASQVDQAAALTSWLCDLYPYRSTQSSKPHCSFFPFLDLESRAPLALPILAVVLDALSQTFLSFLRAPDTLTTRLPSLLQEHSPPRSEITLFPLRRDILVLFCLQRFAASFVAFFKFCTRYATSLLWFSQSGHLFIN